MPKGSVLRAQINDYTTESSATIQDDGYFDFLTAAPPDMSYVGQTLRFRLSVPILGDIVADQTETYGPGRAEFGVKLNFAISAPAPPREPGPQPPREPGPELPPFPMTFAQGHALTREGDPVPKGSVLRAQFNDYTTESSATIQDDGYFDFLTVTPPNSSYVGQTLRFRLSVANVGVIEADQTETYEPRRTEFGVKLNFGISAPAPPREPGPQPPPEPEPQPVPWWKIFQRIIDAILRIFGRRR